MLLSNFQHGRRSFHFQCKCCGYREHTIDENHISLWGARFWCRCCGFFALFLFDNIQVLFDRVFILMAGRQVLHAERSAASKSSRTWKDESRRQLLRFCLDWSTRFLATGMMIGDRRVILSFPLKRLRIGKSRAFITEYDWDNYGLTPSDYDAGRHTWWGPDSVNYMLSRKIFLHSRTARYI